MPSIGSMTKASSASPSRSISAGSAAAASSPISTAPGKALASSALMKRSAASSASVTRSVAERFSRISPSPRLRKRGMTSRRPASARMPASLSWSWRVKIIVVQSAKGVWQGNQEKGLRIPFPPLAVGKG
ncbi:conserved hypothetical protein [Bosea sp. 62]|nr:conserved hypothetical protein [Bosea sp. 21B]CAD5259108.1 conserved hypothetical protein [Bosea sp. 7B]CAD5268775.1 conserved hypothetical protein [Bosea sp. 46]VVT50505.1 conserved hypothetical protein [Bosea sp. EC-HK365B]VXB00441.1 conserved hypothetical protein [Bosea sp. 127]VXC02645.1 conserved hypothetical protein [Bosea sp. 62]VXC08934.1 conserved hypothetical protein [Bosea sp. 29B]